MAEFQKDPLNPKKTCPYQPCAEINGATKLGHSPQTLDLRPLRNLESDNPMDEGYSYPEAFKKLDCQQLRKDLIQLLRTSQQWWPADFGHYGPMFIRTSWHSAGTYRIFDGRGGANRGQQRFDPIISWPDNINVQKSKQFLWPIKQKYGDALSWADLLVLIGDVALQDMGLETIGFAFGRVDDWKFDGTNFGISSVQMSTNVLGDDLKKPFSSSQMGLIYVNPEGPDGKPDRVGAVSHIRQTFSGMGMEDRQTVALIAGGHTFGKSHGAGPKQKHIGPAPGKAPIQQQGVGWHNSFGTGKAEYTIGSGVEGVWTRTPTKWSHDYLTHLYTLDWAQTKSPADAFQWTPTNSTKQHLVPDAHIPGKFHQPLMQTTDLALKEDPEFNKYAMQFYKNPEELKKSFAEAWFKLIHRDMGPKQRYLGPWLPKQQFLWQDPLPKAQDNQITKDHIQSLKKQIINSGLSNQQLIRTAWASASYHRRTDYRGGTNGARIALAPIKDWQMNEPEVVQKVISKLKQIQNTFNGSQNNGTKVSLADLIVLGGNSAIESAAKQAGHDICVPFIGGRVDATQDLIDIKSTNFLKTKVDGFINYSQPHVNPDFLPQGLVEKACLLNLKVPQMTVLIGGFRALDINYKKSKDGVLTHTPGQLNNSFFVNLLDYSTAWKKSEQKGKFVGVERYTGQMRWTATGVDLIFGYNPELKVIAQVYAQKGSEKKFVNDFVKAWDKVMMLGRYDLKHTQ